MLQKAIQGTGTAIGKVHRQPVEGLQVFLAQLSAILLTLLSDACEIFPARMLLSLFASSALGGVIFEKTKKRAAIQHGLRIALLLYTLLSALSCAEQAFLPFSFN